MIFFRVLDPLSFLSLQGAHFGSSQQEMLDPIPLHSAWAASRSLGVSVPSPRVTRAASKRPAEDLGRLSPELRGSEEPLQLHPDGSASPLEGMETLAPKVGKEKRVNRTASLPRTPAKRRRTRQDASSTSPSPATQKSGASDPTPLTNPLSSGSGDVEADIRGEEQPVQPEAKKLPFTIRRTDL
jgi:hypothetical protein